MTGLTVLILVLAAAARANDPTSGVYATFRVARSEIFHAWITDSEGIDQAVALWQGVSRARIPAGLLICESVEWNCPWSWHLDPDSIRFAEFAIEICDGTPSYVEANCGSFGPYYCPWSAELIELRDCREDPKCPPVPHNKAGPQP
jgi:hypothetical protein